LLNTLGEKMFRKVEEPITEQGVKKTKYLRTKGIGKKILMS
jgi:hypothetical protein